MQNKIILIAIGLFALVSTAQGFDLQGHRGARGLAPENTLPAFTRALQIGVHTLELDTGLTRDKVVVVSHNPELNPALTRVGNGQWLTGEPLLVRNLTAHELQQYDVGRIDPNSRYAKRYPKQQAVDGTPIPHLSDVFALVKRIGNEQVRFNIETKINPLHPQRTWSAQEMVDALLEAIQQADMGMRVTLQSFDWRTLKYAQQVAPHIPTVYLSAEQSWLDNIQVGTPGASPWTAGLDIDDFDGSLPHMIAAAGGAVWSPYHKDVDAEEIALAQSLGLKVVVWTVNDTTRARQLIMMGVDGIISDFPDRIRTVMKQRGMPLPATTQVKP